MTLRECVGGSTGRGAATDVPEVLVIAASPDDARALAPLGRASHAEADAPVRPALVATGPDPLAVDAVLDEFDAPAARLLLVDAPGDRWADEAALMVLRLDALLEEARPAAVVVRGGSEAALAAARSAVRLGLPVLHLTDPTVSGLAAATQAAIAELAAWQTSPAGGLAYPGEIDLHVHRRLEATGRRRSDPGVVRMPTMRSPQGWMSA